MKYSELIKIAEKESIKLGLEPRLELSSPSTGEKIKLFDNFCDSALIHMLIERFDHGYWGQQCLNVCAQAFASLQHYTAPCELVFGEVNINGTNEFDTTLEGLKSELALGEQNTGMQIHVWLNIGKDYIIDPTISSRINKYYDSSFPMNKIIRGKANSLEKKMKLKYKPMLVGAKYLELTCAIPLTYNSAEQMA